jgi:excisionase family DNA binding protein
MHPQRTCVSSHWIGRAIESGEIRGRRVLFKKNQCVFMRESHWHWSQAKPAPRPDEVTVAEFVARTGVPKTHVNSMIRKGELRAPRVQRRRSHFFVHQSELVRHARPLEARTTGSGWLKAAQGNRSR